LHDQLIINIINENIDGHLHFKDVARVILKEKFKQKDKEGRVESSKQAEALTMMRGRSIKCGSSGVKLMVDQTIYARSILNFIIVAKEGM